MKDKFIIKHRMGGYYKGVGYDSYHGNYSDWGEKKDAVKIEINELMKVLKFLFKQNKLDELTITKVEEQ